ncbi:MAG: hypothetical protein R2699_10290 [Acidimicrobiales bacterium]
MIAFEDWVDTGENFENFALTELEARPADRLITGPFPPDAGCAPFTWRRGALMHQALA